MSEHQASSAADIPPADAAAPKAGGKMKPGKQKLPGKAGPAAKDGKGPKLAKGTEWKLSATKGGVRELSATCIGVVNVGGARIAMFKIPKKPG